MLIRPCLWWKPELVYHGELCHRCGKVIRFEDNEIQNYQLKRLPEQFCECFGNLIEE